MTLFSPPVLFDMVFIDVSQFVMEPLRTGVQRVLMKVIEHAPRERIMPFCVLDETHAAILDPAVFDLGIRYFAAGRPAARALVADAHGKPRQVCEEDMLIRLVGRQPLAVLDAADFFARAERVINLEAFSRAERSLFYSSCAPEHRGRVFHFIHDLLLFETPEVFPQLNWRYASDYVLLFEAYCAAGGFYVSTQAMARKVAHYFNRPRGDICVVNFGGDLGAGPPAAKPTRRDGRRQVVVVGTIEPRKYPAMVADALFRLAAYHTDLDCTIIGKFGWVDDATRTRIENVIATGLVRHHADMADAAVRQMMAAADVGIYVSSNEGFGLPVIEFAALGVPVVTNNAVPAASLVGTRHATVLETVGLGELVVAVEHRLAQPAPTGPYYASTWAECARQIFAWRDAGRSSQSASVDGQVCWQGCAGLVRTLRSRRLAFDEVRHEVRQHIASDALMRSAVLAGGGAAARAVTLVEAMTEIVYENRKLIHWADLIQTRQLLAELVRALGGENRLDGLRRAFIAYVGRPIDPRAASEAVRLVGAGELLDRIVDVIHCDEATVYLGAQKAAALRHVVGGVREILTMCMMDHIDLFCLNEFLGMNSPELQDVLLVEELVCEGIDRIELLLYLTHQRNITGDALDIFLEVAAEVCRERGTRIAAGDGAPTQEGRLF